MGQLQRRSNLQQRPAVTKETTKNFHYQIMQHRSVTGTLEFKATSSQIMQATILIVASSFNISKHPNDKNMKSSTNHIYERQL